MSLGTKLVFSLVAPLTGLMALFLWLNQERNQRLLHEELARQGRELTRTVQWAMEDAVRDGQLENTRELVDEITGYERVLGLRIFDRDGNLYYQSVNLANYPFSRVDAVDSVLRDRQPVETHQVIGGQPVSTFIFPLSRPQGILFGAVEILHLESFIQEASRASRDAVMVLTAVMMLATTGIILVITRVSVARPIEALVRRFREVGAGLLSARVPVREDDELGRLAQEFNRMGERLEQTQRSLLEEQEQRRRMEARLRDAQRLASLGRLAAGVAHEIGTPLNVIGGRAEGLLRRVAGDEPAEKNLRIISSQIDRIARIVRGMLDFARARTPRLAPIQVPTVLTSIFDLLEPRLEKNKVKLVVACPDGLPTVRADPDQIQQVFLNLAANALDAMPDGGTLRVSADEVRRRPLEGEGVATGIGQGVPGGPGGPGQTERLFLAIVFEDTGQGIAQEDLGRVFDPFFTTKEIGQGTGLGLSIAYGIAREHGGWLEADTLPGSGARMTVFLPLEQASAPPALALLAS